MIRNPYPGHCNSRSGFSDPPAQPHGCVPSHPGSLVAVCLQTNLVHVCSARGYQSHHTLFQTASSPADTTDGLSRIVGHLCQMFCPRRPNINAEDDCSNFVASRGAKVLTSLMFAARHEPLQGGPRRSFVLSGLPMMRFVYRELLATRPCRAVDWGERCAQRAPGCRGCLARRVLEALETPNSCQDRRRCNHTTTPRGSGFGSDPREISNA